MQVPDVVILIGLKPFGQFTASVTTGQIEWGTDNGSVAPEMSLHPSLNKLHSIEEWLFG